MDEAELEALRLAFRGEEPAFIRWDAARAEELPEVERAVADFDPGRRLPAKFCAEWLWSEALTEPQTSTPRLCVAAERVLGFYALANGEVQLKSKDRKRAGLGGRPTQPAVLLTHIARGRGEDAGTGRLLVMHAIGKARASREQSAATVLALDPYDEPTAEMWAREYAFRKSMLSGPGRPEALRRMWIPLVGD